MTCRSEDYTAGNSDLILTLAISYSGRSDLTHAARQIAEQVQAGLLDAADVTEDLVSAHLQSAHVAAHVGPVDLLIRTSDEVRLSNFLLWELAYSELYFASDVFWPDFGEEDYAAALGTYAQRERRFGKRAAAGQL